MPILPDVHQRLVGLTAIRARGALMTSSVFVVVANLMVLAGVIFFGWKAFDIILIYWLESVVIGVFTALKLKKVGKKAPMQLSFFILHYGGLSFSMFLCIVGFFGPGGYSNSISAYKMTATMQYLFGDGFLDIATALVSFVSSHGFSYWRNFLGKREYHDPKIVKMLVAEPYARLIITIALVIFTSWAIPKFKLPLMAGAIFLIALKTIADLLAHHREHPESDLPAK